MTATSRNMRVLVIGRLTSIHTVRFCEELQRQGEEVAVLWIGKATAHPNVRVYHTDRNMRIFGIPRTAAIGCLLYIRNAIQDFRPHIIHVQDDGQMAYWLNLVCPSKVVRAYTNWGHDPELVRRHRVRRGLAK